MKIKTAFFLFILLFFSGCAYINTLYNGASSYKKAQRTEKQAQRMSKDSAQTATQTNPLYKRAVEKADKTLLEYPKSEKAHDNAYFLKGISLFSMGEFISATDAFEIILEYYPESKYVPRTYLFLAKSYAKLEDFLTAETYVNTLLEKFPNMKNNRDLIMLRADLAVELEGKFAAISALEKRLEEATNTLSKLLIIERLMGLNMENGDYEKAYSYTENMPAFDKKHWQIYYKIEFRKLQCLRQIYKRDEAIELADFMLKRPNYLYNRSEIMLEKAITFVDMGKYDDAIRVFEDIIAISGDRKIRCKTWYEYAGVNIDVKGLLDTGKVQLDSALSLVGDDIEMRLVITKRLDGLKNIADLQKKMEESDPFEPIDSAYYRYRIGEEYWLSATLPDSALVYFDSLITSLKTPDSTRAKALYSRAYILKSIKKDTIEAERIFNEIIEKYPHFEAAKSSQIMLEIPVTLMTRRDSANVQFAAAEKLFLESQESYSQEAYYAYLLCALKFPDIKDVAAKALFSAGWVVNKRDFADDGVVDTAVVKIFVRLCNEYPESEHCKQAETMMNANEVKSYATQYTARNEIAVDIPASTEDETEGEQADKSRRKAVLPDFQKWL
ncbi:MAG: tetratricopeptide repeat protein [Chitinivibrionia bacterium]|nr:tetratricopeptide repeat protein [Chitinivibrionia bacterium]